jgi:hypothetical protein
LLEANEEQFKEATAMINSPIIERVLEESGLAQRIRAPVEQEKARLEQEWERDRQIWAAERQKLEADREAEKAELREKLRLLEQSLKEQAAQHRAEKAIGGE